MVNSHPLYRLSYWGSTVLQRAARLVAGRDLYCFWAVAVKGKSALRRWRGAWGSAALGQGDDVAAGAAGGAVAADLEAGAAEAFFERGIGVFAPDGEQAAGV